MDTQSQYGYGQKQKQNLSDVLEIFYVILSNKDSLFPVQICQKIKLFKQCQDQSLKKDFLSGVESLLNYQKNKFNQFSLLFEKAKEAQQKMKNIKRTQFFTNILRQFGEENINMKKISHEIEQSQLFDQNFKINVQKIGSRLESAQKCQKILLSAHLSLKPQQLQLFFEYIQEVTKFSEAVLSQNIKDFKKIQKYYAINFLTYWRHLIDLVNIKINEAKSGSKDRILHQGQQSKQEEERKQKQSQKLQIQIEQLKKQHQNLVNKLQKDLKMLQQQKNQLVDRLAEQQRLNIAINTERQTLKQKNIIIQNEKEQQYKQLEKIKTQKQQLSKDNFNLTKQIQQLNGKISQLLKLQQKIKLLQQQNNKLKLNISNLENGMKQKQRSNEENLGKLHQYQSNNLKLKDEIKTKDNNLDEIRSKLSHAEHQINQKNQAIKKLENEIYSLVNKVKQYQNSFQEQLSASTLLNTNLESKNQKIKQYEVMIHEFKNLSYFFGPIFKTEFQKNLKDDLISQISKNTGKEISETQRIYAFDKKNPVSPHKYIDDVPDWVLLFKLRNGYIIGGFCRDPITPMKKEGFIHQGFMFSLNSKKFYSLPNNSGKTTIYQYQQYYLIIGNSEIRFNLQSKMIQSQFGGRFKYFETGQDTVATFFGSNEEKFEIETYEFYHLIFE